MKVKELIELLEGYDPESAVHFSYGYGDHWRTQVAPEVTQLTEGAVTYSDYHRMDKLVDTYEDEEEGEVTRSVVVLC